MPTVSERAAVHLLDSESLGVFDVRCFAPAGGPRSEELPDVTQVVMPIGGVFEVHRGSASVVADAASVVVLAAGREHRVGHPGEGGDRSLVLVFPPDVLEGAIDPDGTPGGPVSSRVHLGARILHSSLRREAVDEMEAEDLGVRLLDLIVGDLDRACSLQPPGRHQRDRVERVRALLAAAPERRWRLAELARAVHCSPFHLARQFRALIGVSIATSLLRLRLALALERLAEGEADLAGLAADLGFANHSHMSARFRSVFGVSPSSVRDSLPSGRLAELRTMVTAENSVAP